MMTSQLHIVSGKGGTGKTTVAAALSLALASAADDGRGGGRVLLAEVEGRQGLAQVFDRAPLGGAPSPLAVGPGGGEVFGLAVDIEAAFLAYLDGMVGGLRRTRPLLRRFGVVEFATEVMPGLRDLLLIEAVVSQTLGRAGRSSRWDAVVLDAPPTGRIARFLSVADEVTSLARVGGFAAQAARVMSVLRSEATAVHLATLLEPMPVQETLDAAVELADERFPLGLVIVNRARTRGITRQALAGEDGTGFDSGRLRIAAKAAGLSLDEPTFDGLVAQAEAHADRLRLEAEERQSLDTVGRPVVELPDLRDGVDLGGLYRLAAVLKHSLQNRARTTGRR